MNETTYSSLVVHQRSPAPDTPPVGLDIPGRYLIGTDPNAVVRLHVKLSDFGLAKVYNTAGYSEITPSNEICGTLAYMSPEQLLDSRSAKPDADIYAAVVCLYRLLTEEYPHPEGSPVETIQRRLHDDPRPVRTFNSHVPAELARIVDRGLSRTREQRYAAAGELHAALSSLTLLRQEPR